MENYLLKNDLQSFTLLRFLAPELEENKELILVIDPDIFAIKDPIEILNYHNENSDISCTFMTIFLDLK